MKLNRQAGYRRQRGIVAVMAVIFLITAVVFVLTQALNITGTTSIDNKQQIDSTAALFLAESGLEKAQAIITTASKNTYSKDQCCIAGVGSCSATGSFPSGNQTVGNGHFNYVSATPTPATCDGLTTPCTACAVTVSGTMGTASRQITRTFGIIPGNAPPFCNTANTVDCSNQTATTWSLSLSKYASLPAGMGVFNLAVDLTAGSSGCYTGTGGCLSPASSTKQWELPFSSSVLGLGTTVAQASTDTTVFQRLSASRDVSLTGALFPASGSAPAVVGRYFNNGTVGSSTVGGGSGTAENNLKGQITNGGSTGAWCDGTSGGDTLVFGYSAHSTTARSDQLVAGEVLLDTRAGLTGIPLTRISKSPINTDSTAGDKVYSEIWYKKNAPFSHGFYLTGIINNNPVTFNIQPTNNTNYGQLRSDVVGTIGKGDLIDPGTCNSGAIPTGARITGFGSTTSCSDSAQTITNAAKNYYVCWSGTPATNSANCKGYAYGSNGYNLQVKTVVGGSISIGYKLAGDQVTDNTAITSTYTPIQTGYISAWNLSVGSPAWSLKYTNASTGVSTDQPMVVNGATVNNSTVTLPAVHNVLTDGTIIAVRTLTGMGSSLNGRLQTNTTATNQTSTTLQLSQAAVTNSVPNGAILCGGTCAFFDHANNNTEFRIAGTKLPGNTDRWAAGFTCLNNAGVPSPLSGGSATLVKPGLWQEVIN